MKQFTRLQSSALQGADYDPDTSQLTISFRSGKSYTFENVPERVFTELQDAASPGAYFHQYIKDQY
jgi:hypothetical protein